jgi:hypothetical protein
MPQAQGSLLIGIDYPYGGISASLCLNRQMSRQSGFATPAFLGCDDDCFHELNLSS